MPNTQYNLLDDDGTLFLVNYMFTKLKNSPLNTNTTYTLTKDTANSRYVLTGTDGTSTYAPYTEYDVASASAAGLMSASDFTKLAGIASGAQVNIIEKVKVNGTALVIDTSDKSVDVITLTSAEVNQMIQQAISEITGLQFVKVNSYADLPATGDSSTIYLVPNSGTAPNVYDEYIWFTDTSTTPATSGYEKIGTTAIDLSGYVQYTDISLMTNSEIADIVDDAYDDVFNPQPSA